MRCCCYCYGPGRQAELCAPIVNSSGTVIGIIDAESWSANHFSPAITSQLLQLAHNLGEVDLLWSKELRSGLFKQSE